MQAITQLGEALERGAEVRSPAAYLWRTALNLIVSEVRRRERELPAGDRAAMEDALEAAEGHGVGSGVHLYRPLPVELAEFPPEFDRAIRELPEDERDSFILTELRGATTREAADILGVSHMTVSRRSNAAHEHVRGLLAA